MRLNLKLINAGCASAILVAVLLLPQQALATYPMVVTDDRGGLVQSRVNQIAQLKKSGQPVEIRGRCLSTCTMLLGYRNTCVKYSATFGFHGPSHYGQPLQKADFEKWSRTMASYYRGGLKSWYMNKGRHNLRAPAVFSARQLIKMGAARPCKK